MPKPLLTSWSGSLHKSFRVLPTGSFTNDDLLAFLNSEEGDPWQSVHEKLPYARERAASGAGAAADGGDDDEEDEEAPTPLLPDTKRYRDLRQVLENCGLMWEDGDGRIHFTELGRSLKRFMPIASERNITLFSQHAALALNVCQLRNPTGAGRRYHADMTVFPFRFIWRAMLRLGGRINSDELNRAIFATRNPDMLTEAIERIRSYRVSHNLDDLGAETVSGRSKNDRLIPIVCLASFGWTLINQKDSQGYYTIRPHCTRILEAAASVPVVHREYPSVEAYVTRISRAACLPKDVR